MAGALPHVENLGSGVDLLGTTRGVGYVHRGERLGGPAHPGAADTDHSASRPVLSDSTHLSRVASWTAGGEIWLVLFQLMATQGLTNPVRESLSRLVEWNVTTLEMATGREPDVLVVQTLADSATPMVGVVDSEATTLLLQGAGTSLSEVSVEPLMEHGHAGGMGSLGSEQGCGEVDCSDGHLLLPEEPTPLSVRSVVDEVVQGGHGGGQMSDADKPEHDEGQ